MQTYAEAVLAKTADLLANCVDYESTMEKVAELAVTNLATWCIVDIVNDAGAIERVAVAHSDPSKAALAEVIKTRYPASPKAGRGVYRVISTGKAILIPETPESLWSQRADDPEHLRIIMELGSTSYMCVPLIARSRVVGSIILMCSTRTYGNEDLALAEALASRFALAVDNALMFRQLKAAVQAREEFLSIAAHELRTPLTPLLMQQNLLERLMNQANPGQANRKAIGQLLAISSDQVRRLSYLVNSLLDATKVRTCGLQLEPAPMELRELALAVIETFQVEAAAAGSSLQLLGSERVAGHWDRARLEQVLINLVSNAIKYGQGRPIKLRVGAADNQAWLSITDQGPGVAPEDQTRIFNRFERLSRHKSNSGLGLGLYISRQLVELHKGRLELESVPGQGATFTVVLPRQ